MKRILHNEVSHPVRLHVDLQHSKNCTVCTPIAWHLQGHYMGPPGEPRRWGIPIGYDEPCLNSPVGEAYRNAVQVQVEGAMKTSL